MQIIRDYTKTPKIAKNCALAIGNFDGVHQGHVAVIRKMLQVAKTQNIPSAIMVFEPHPRRFFSSDTPSLMLEPFHIKARRFKSMGVEFLFVIRFNKEFSSLTAESFVNEVLLESISVSHIVTGDNFIFGKKRSGDVPYLTEQASLKNFNFTAVRAVKTATSEREITCSSSRIRYFLSVGNITDANNLLGREYEIYGKVRNGDKKAREIGFPTANIEPQTKLFKPLYGVYKVRFSLSNGHDDYGSNGDITWYDGIANYGLRPTVNGVDNVLRLEVHGFDIPKSDKNMYGKHIRVKFMSFVRKEIKFNSFDELKEQIKSDIENVRKFENA